jgi:predicted peptidase
VTQLPLKPGIHELRFPTDGRRYTLSIPEAFDPAHPAPLVIALHWGGPVAPYTGKWLLLGLVEHALRELNAILAAPDRTRDDWANPQSEDETLELLDSILESYPIDERRILLTGYSLGGIGTWYMAAKNQERFAGALPISAMPLPDSAQTDWRIPLYAIHSRMDEIFPLQQVEQTIHILQTGGADAQLDILEGITHFETERFQPALQAAVPWIQRIWA